MKLRLQKGAWTFNMPHSSMLAYNESEKNMSQTKQLFYCHYKKIFDFRYGKTQYLFFYKRQVENEDGLDLKQNMQGLLKFQRLV